MNEFVAIVPSVAATVLYLILFLVGVAWGLGAGFGDTLFAATKVTSKAPVDERTGSVTLRVVGTKNVPARPLLERTASLFEPELTKAEGRVPEKVVEITRTLLVQRRPA